MSMKLIRVACAVCLGLAAFAASGNEKSPVCQAEAIQAAVDQLKELPADYDSFASLPEEYKKAVYLRLTDTERAALWQEHWQVVLAAGKLDEEQRLLIAEAGRFWTADTFAALRSPEGLHYSATDQLVREFKTRLQASFDKKQMTALFGRIGPLRSQIVRMSVPGGGGYNELTGELANLEPPCGCSIEDNDCYKSTYCTSRTRCAVTSTCGFMMGGYCDGDCTFDP